MLENEDRTTTADTAAPTDGAGTEQAATRPRRRRAASRPAGPPEAVASTPDDAAPATPEADLPPQASDADEDEDGAETAEGPGASDGPTTRSATTPQFTQGAASATTARPRRRATAAAGPPSADIFAAPVDTADRAEAGRGSTGRDDTTGTSDASLPTDPEDAAADAPADAAPARATRARRGRRRPEADVAQDDAGDAGGGAAGSDPGAASTPGSDGPAGTDDAARPGPGAGVPATDRQDTAPGAEDVAADDPAEETRPRPRRSRRRATAAITDLTDDQAAIDATAVDGSRTDEGEQAERGGRTVPDLATLADLVAGQDTSATDDDDEGEEDEQGSGRARRGGRSRRRRGGRGRGNASGATGGEDDADEGTPSAGDDTPRRGGRSEGGTDGSDGSDGSDDADGTDGTEDDDGADTDDSTGSRSSRRRRRRRRRAGGGDADLAADPDDPPGTVVRIRESRVDEVTKVKGSTRLEAKRQRRRDGRTTSRKRTVITEAEFLTRRESVDRTLLVREGQDRTEIAVLEDGVLVEHHVTRASQQSMIGNVYLGRVQNVLPSMEAAFVDIGRGRNAVLYAGEVNWDAVGLTNGSQRKIEDALKPGDPVLAQVSKDPIGHKGARLTAQVSLPGRYLVYVPGSSMTGISRKLPETERTRLKKVLRRVVPEDAGVIVRTAAEGASETELERDVARLKAQWEDIEAKSTAVQAPARLYSEPDLAIKVVRDVFNEDFTRLVVSGDDTWDTLDGYVRHVAPDLAERMTRWAPEDGSEPDLFVHHRIDEQIAKALDRKVWLPSGGSLVIDRTEAMTVVDVNTGKYTGSGGNLEETVTRNNLEAAEEIVRQLRLRDIGGIIVVDFIDMVLENNRNLVLRRLVECLGRDRTKHQVAEVTSLGLVQLTRKRVGSGLLESFSTPCEHCHGRGLVTHAEPVGVGNELPAGPGDTGGRSSAGGSSGGGGGARRRGGRPGG